MRSPDRIFRAAWICRFICAACSGSTGTKRSQGCGPTSTLPEDSTTMVVTSSTVATISTLMIRLPPAADADRPGGRLRFFARRGRRRDQHVEVVLRVSRGRRLADRLPHAQRLLQQIDRLRLVRSDRAGAELMQRPRFRRSITGGPRALQDPIGDLPPRVPQAVQRHVAIDGAAQRDGRAPLLRLRRIVDRAQHVAEFVRAIPVIAEAPVESDRAATAPAVDR